MYGYPRATCMYGVQIRLFFLVPDFAFIYMYDCMLYGVPKVNFNNICGEDECRVTLGNFDQNCRK